MANMLPTRTKSDLSCLSRAVSAAPANEQLRLFCPKPIGHLNRHRLLALFQAKDPLALTTGEMAVLLLAPVPTDVLVMEISFSPPMS